MNILEIDDVDNKILSENYDKELLDKLDYDNVNKIYGYLINNGIYYAKDIFVGQVDLFLLDYDDFVSRFEKLKTTLGSNYVELFGSDISYVNDMYLDD